MRRTTKLLTALCAMILASGSCSLPKCIAAGGDINRGYDWTLTAETEELQRYFEYTNSNLRPLDKISIEYYQGDQENSASPYEKLWYHDGQPLGRERQKALSVTRGENICLRITHHNSKPAPGEYKAAANTILQVWLDAHLNKNQLVVVKVPTSQSLQAIVNELVQKQKLVLMQDGNAEDPIKSTMTLLIVSEADGQQMHLAYL